METSTNYSKTADVRRADKSENITPVPQRLTYG